MTIWQVSILCVIVGYLSVWLGEIAGARFARWQHERKNHER